MASVTQCPAVLRYVQYIVVVSGTVLVLHKGFAEVVVSVVVSVVGGGAWIVLVLECVVL